MVAEEFKITDQDKVTIVNQHNDFRRNLAKGLENRGSPGPQPSVTNMRELVGYASFIWKMCIRLL